MTISPQEQEAIKAAIDAGRRFGYGNIISHLKTAWATRLMEQGLEEKVAREAAGGFGYPFQMQDDLLGPGWWDETGERYRS